MALFSDKEQKEIPLLTQFYQLSVPADQEQLLGSELERFLWLNSLQGIFANRDGPERRVKKLIPWAEFHRQIVELMDAIADNGSVPASLLKQIAKELNEEPRPNYRLVNKRVTVPDSAVNQDMQDIRAAYEAARKRRSDDSWIPDDSLVSLRDIGLAIVNHDEVFTLRRKILVEVSKLLSLDIKNVGLRRCTVCNSPFPPKRADQQYCSHRCGARVHARRSSLI